MQLEEEEDRWAFKGEAVSSRGSFRIFRGGKFWILLFIYLHPNLKT